jgi:hypothetical protein
MKYTLGSSFFTGGPRQVADLSEDWCLNLTRADIAPAHVVIICEGGTRLKCYPPHASVIYLDGDLGHCHDVLARKKKNEWSGWSASMVALAMIAYTNETDFVYKESDCFAFGPWVARLYADMGNGLMAFGPKHTSPPWATCSQSLFIVRHEFIPTFVSAYLSMGGETSIPLLGEQKFCRIEAMFGTDKIRRMSFGVDRERPIPWAHSPMYFQQPKPEEIAEARRRGLL